MRATTGGNRGFVREVAAEALFGRRQRRVRDKCLFLKRGVGKDK